MSDQFELSFKGISGHQALLAEELKETRELQDLLTALKGEMEVSGTGDIQSLLQDMERIGKVRSSISARSEFLDWLVDRFHRVSETNSEVIREIEARLSQTIGD